MPTDRPDTGPIDPSLPLDAILARLTLSMGLTAYRWAPLPRWCRRCGGSGVVPRAARYPMERAASGVPTALSGRERLVACPACRGEGTEVLIAVVPNVSYAPDKTIREAPRPVLIDVPAVESLSGAVGICVSPETT